MQHAECIFCKIIAGEIPAVKIRENDAVVVIKDIAPKAPIHYLIIPKRHITNVASMTEHDKELMGETMLMARDLAKDLHEGVGFNLVSNNGRDAGQSVFHLHWHFIAGKNLWHGKL
jgi:diadenosine tetraphosphate (Ap4A) HIT family hydrolase